MRSLPAGELGLEACSFSQRIAPRLLRHRRNLRGGHRANAVSARSMPLESARMSQPNETLVG